MFPFDVLRIIVSFVDDPKTFHGLLRISKDYNSICNEFIHLKRKQFLRKVYTKQGYYHVLPNGVKEGPSFFKKGDISVEKTLVNGKTEGKVIYIDYPETFTYYARGGLVDGVLVRSREGGLGPIRTQNFVNGKKKDSTILSRGYKYFYEYEENKLVTLTISMNNAGDRKIDYSNNIRVYYPSEFFDLEINKCFL